MIDEPNNVRPFALRYNEVFKELVEKSKAMFVLAIQDSFCAGSKPYRMAFV